MKVISVKVSKSERAWKPLATAQDLREIRGYFETTVLVKCEKGHFEELGVRAIDWEEVDGLLSVNFSGSSSFDFCLGCEREEPVGARSAGSRQSAINAVIASIERYLLA